QPGEHQGVRVDPPLQLALAGAEPGTGLGDRLERHVQHGVVEHDSHQAGDQDAEDEPAAAVDPVLSPGGDGTGGNAARCHKVLQVAGWTGAVVGVTPVCQGGPAAHQANDTETTP